MKYQKKGKEISAENYLRKKKIQKENMEEIGVKLWKGNKRLKEYQGNHREGKKSKSKIFKVFSLHTIKNGTKNLDFLRKNIVKCYFHTDIKPININDADIKRTVLCKKRFVW